MIQARIQGINISQLGRHQYMKIKAWSKRRIGRSFVWEESRPKAAGVGLKGRRPYHSRLPVLTWPRTQAAGLEAGHHLKRCSNFVVLVFIICQSFKCCDLVIFNQDLYYLFPSYLSLLCEHINRGLYCMYQTVYEFIKKLRVFSVRIFILVFVDSNVSDLSIGVPSPIMASSRFEQPFVDSNVSDLSIGVPSPIVASSPYTKVLTSIQVTGRGFHLLKSSIQEDHACVSLTSPLLHQHHTHPI